jgi:hypothetical protein
MGQLLRFSGPIWDSLQRQFSFLCSRCWLLFYLQRSVTAFLICAAAQPISGVKKMELTEQESQLLEMIRGLDEGEQLRLAVARRNGQWDVIVSAPPVVRHNARGVGATFDAAWDNLVPLEMEGFGGG